MENLHIATITYDLDGEPDDQDDEPEEDGSFAALHAAFASHPIAYCTHISTCAHSLSISPLSSALSV